MKAIFDLVSTAFALYVAYLILRVTWSIGRSLWWAVRGRR